MNILYTNFHVEDGGGHTTYILSLLKNTEHTKFVGCPSTSMLYKRLAEQGYDKLIALDFPAKFRHKREIPKSALALKKAIVDNNIDIVHTNGSPDNRMALYASLLTFKRFKVVHTKHNTIGINNYLSKLRLNWFNNATIFVGDFIEYLGLDANFSRYHIIPNGINLDHWKRQEPIHTGNNLTLISNAGASRHKGWHHLMEAIEGLAEEDKKRLSVVMLARHEMEMDKELNEAGNICNFERPGFFDDIRPFLEKADIGFVLSYKEACSFACREMLSMGLPVITSDFMTLVHDVGPSCGWVTKMKDPESIRTTLRSILAMLPDQLNALKMAARKKAEAEFSIDTMIAKTNAVYADVMKK